MNAVVQVPRLATPGPCPVIETRRLRLRPHRMEDADAIAQSLGDFQVSRMLARVPLPFDREDALDWLNRTATGVTPDWPLAITTGDDVHIGVVDIELRHGRWHLGYWLNRCFWGRGYAGEAVSAAIERFFRRMPEITLHSGVFADNGASLHLQEKLGFTVTGCGEVFSRARGGMVAHIETRLIQAEFRPVG